MDKSLLIRRMLHSSFFMIGAMLAIFVILFTLVSPVLTPFDPADNSIKEKFTPPDFSQGLEGHLFGTDQMGRDIFARLSYGGRYSLIVAFITVALQLILGSVLGIVAGYLGKIADSIVMRLCDFFLSIPNIVLAIAIMAVLGSNMFNLIFVLTITGWVQYCKITRNTVMVVKKQEFVQASKCLGSSKPRIMFTQILPNTTTQLIVITSQQIGQVILLEAALSFLNLGIPSPAPSWGNMISAGREYLAIYPWMVLVPGIALMLTVLAFNFLGDGLRDVFDPKKING